MTHRDTPTAAAADEQPFVTNLSVPLVAMVTQLTMPAQHNALMQRAILNVNDRCKATIARIGK